MAVILGDKVLDFASGRILHAVASNEVVRDVVLLRVGDLAVRMRRGAIGAVGELGHGCGCMCRSVTVEGSDGHEPVGGRRGGE